MARPELADELFTDLTASLIQNKQNKKLLNRASALMAEGHDAPTAWYAAMREAGIGISKEQAARFREYALLSDQSRAPKPGPFARGRTSAGSPPDVPHRADEDALPRTPVVTNQLLADNDALSAKAEAWIAKQMRRGRPKPDWKTALLVVSRQASGADDDAEGQSSAEPKATYAELKAVILAAESPVASTQQPKPVGIQKAIATATTQSSAGPLTSGYRWSPAGGWTLEQADPWTNAVEAVLATAARIPPAAPDQRRTDLQSAAVKLSESAHALMKGRGQTIHPKSKNYLTHFKDALVEVSRTT